MDFQLEITQRMKMEKTVLENNPDLREMLDLFGKHQKLTRSQVRTYTGFSDRKARTLIRELRQTILPNRRGETIVNLPSTHVYELTADPVKIETYRLYLQSYVDSFLQDLNSLRNAGRVQAEMQLEC